MDSSFNLETSLANNKNIKYDLIVNEMKTISLPNMILGFNPPNEFISFFTKYHSLNITHPRNFQILQLEKMVVVENRFLIFSAIDNIGIAFDAFEKNVANEWDIVNINNKYLITKTLGSFIQNKLWAWVNRGRKIWDEEDFPS